jgi:adenylate cyclase
MVALSFTAMGAKHETAEMAEVLRVAQRVIDLADGDPTKGNLIFESPLTLATVMRGVARWCVGVVGWKGDLDRAAVLARQSNTATIASAATIATVTWFTYTTAIPYGVLLPDATALEDTRQALALAEQTGDDLALDLARATRGITLFYQEGPQHETALALFAKTRERALEEQFASVAVPIVDIHIAREKARLGDLDGAIGLSRTVLDGLSDSSGWIWNALATSAVAETLLERNEDGDLEDAQSALDRLASVQTDPGFVLNEITLLRLRALLAQAHGDEAAYCDYRDRYRAMARTLEFEGHMKWAEAMP